MSDIDHQKQDRPACPNCGHVMVRTGWSRSGAQTWRCKPSKGRPDACGKGFHNENPLPEGGQPILPTGPMTPRERVARHRAKKLKEPTVRNYWYVLMSGELPVARIHGYRLRLAPDYPNHEIRRLSSFGESVREILQFLPDATGKDPASL